MRRAGPVQGLVHRPLPLVIGSDKPRHKPEDWSDKEVATWLSVLPDSLHQYASLFRRHDINGKVGTVSSKRRQPSVSLVSFC